MRKPIRCKFVEGFGPGAFRCPENARDGRPGSTTCWDHRWWEAERADAHRARVPREEEAFTLTQLVARARGR